MEQREDQQAGTPPVGSLTYLIGTYPLLTTTFIDREIAQVRSRGVDVRIMSLRRPHGALSPAQSDATGEVDYVLPVSPGKVFTSHLEMLVRHPVRYLRTLTYLLTRPHPNLKARGKTLLHFGEAGVAAQGIARHPPEHLHAHFVDRAATVALACSRILAIPYSVTAHANDIYVDPVLLTEKAGEAKVLITCTRHNGAHLRQLVGSDAPIAVIHHGLDLSPVTPTDHGAGTDPPVVLAVGQLKEKKGFRHLIDACALLVESGQSFRCVLVGAGPLDAALRDQVDRLGLSPVVQMPGALPHQEVMEWMRRASVFVLPAVVAADGDRDGIPSVILEAMATQVPVVSTRHSGIPEAVHDGVSGLLTEPGDPADLARAIGRLLDDPGLRKELGSAGREIVERDFSLERNVDAFLAELGRR